MRSALSQALFVALAATLLSASVTSAHLVTHDLVPLGTAWGAPHGNVPGDPMFTENSIALSVHRIWLGGIPFFNETRIDPEVIDVGGTSVFGSIQTLRLNNVGVRYDFSAFPPDPSGSETVTVEFLDLGGDENLDVNGAGIIQVPDFTVLHGAAVAPGVTAFCDPAWRIPVDLNLDGVPEGFRSWLRLVSTGGGGGIAQVQIGGQELWVDDIHTTRSAAGSGGPCPHLVDFESRPTGEVFGNPVGMPPGTFMFNEGGVDLYTNPFFPGGGGPLYNEGVVDPILGAPFFFHAGVNIFRFNNMDVLFDLTATGGPIDDITFEWLSLGGVENLEVNGHAMYIGDIELAPAPIAPGVTFSTTVVPVPGGVKGTARLRGQVDKLVIGGQELWIDDLCAKYVGYGTGGGGGNCPVLVDHESMPIGTLWNGAVFPVGGFMFLESGVKAYSREWVPPVGPTQYDYAEIDPQWATPINPTSFGDSQILELANFGVYYDLSAISSVVTVEFDWLDVGGTENLEVNHAGLYVGELDMAPIAIAPGVTFNTTVVAFVGGKKGHATLTGPVQSLRIAGQEFWIDNICIDGVPAATDAPVLGGAADAGSLELAAAPNPFRDGTSISYSLPAAGPVQAKVYDVLGRSVATLQDGVQDAGSHTLRWDGRSVTGTHVAAGTYFVRLQTRAGAETRKLLLVK
jgi:hypothetical protein